MDAQNKILIFSLDQKSKFADTTGYCLTMGKWMKKAFCSKTIKIDWTQNSTQSCRNLFPVCQSIGLADVDNVSDLSNICWTYIFFATSTELHILAKSIKWFVYSFKWYLGILKVSTTHFCVTCGNIHTIQ